MAAIGRSKTPERRKRGSNFPTRRPRRSLGSSQCGFTRSRSHSGPRKGHDVLLDKCVGEPAILNQLITEIISQVHVHHTELCQHAQAVEAVQD